MDTRNVTHNLGVVDDWDISTTPRRPPMSLQNSPYLESEQNGRICVVALTSPKDTAPKCLLNIYN